MTNWTCLLGNQKLGRAVPDSPIGGAGKDHIAAGAQALDVSCEELDLPHFPRNCTSHVPLAQDVAAAAAAEHTRHQ